jgi:hypothetical protein
MYIPIQGCAYFNNRKERRKLFYEIKNEYGDQAKIKIKRNYITYTVENKKEMFI